MRKRDVFTMLETLNGLSTGKTNAKFAYFIAKNKKVLKDEADIIREVLSGFKSPERFEEYENKRMELCRKMAEKDDEGNPKIIGDSYAITDLDGFDKKLNTLKKKYDDVIKENEDLRKQIDEFLNEDFDIDKLSKVNLSSFSNEITPGQMESLFVLVNEDDL